MTDLNGRTISVGDYTDGGKITALDQTTGLVTVQAFNTLATPYPAGYTILGSKIQTGDKVWSTCWPRPCDP